MLRVLVSCALGLLLGCNGVIGDSLGDAAPTPSGEPRCGRSVCGATGELAAGTAFPRLTHAQWENSVRDLLRLDSNPGLSGTFEPDTSVSFFENNSRVLRVSSDLWTNYQSAAERVAEQVTADGASLGNTLPDDLPAEPNERARAVVRDLSRRAYRRTLSDAELDAHVALFEQGAAHFPEMSAFDAGVRMLIEALLQSPHFVYRIEIGREGNGNTVQLDDFEIATRLSYMIWNTMPDEVLFGEAERGALNTPDQVAAQAGRMLEDPKGRALLERFHAQLLGWDLYRDLSKDPAQFPLYYAGIGDDMVEEARRFVEHVVLEEDGNLAELLTAPYTFANDGLASVYGYEGFDGTFSQLFFDGGADPQRGGILTQLGFLASHGGLTGSVHRGVFINHRLLCTDLPPPPDALPPIPGDEGMTMTSRQRIEMHTGPGTCGASCHGTYINPIGFAFESFDGLGQVREVENGLPIDAAASFEFQDGVVEFDGAAELNGAMADRIEAHDCYAKHWVEYALGRDTAGADLDLIQSLGDGSADGASIKSMIVELVRSEAFRTRNAGGS